MSFFELVLLFLILKFIDAREEGRGGRETERQTHRFAIPLISAFIGW